MKYEKNVILPSSINLVLRNARAAEGKEVLDIFNQAHEETDFLLTYADEGTFTVEQEAEYLKDKEESSNEIEIVAVIDGKIVGTAGIESCGNKCKVRHRAEFGISIVQEYCGLGIGRRLTEACIECAKNAGYEQIELQVVADNERAIALYKRVGFVEFGRNPLGFKSRITGFQELIYH